MLDKNKRYNLFWEGKRWYCVSEDFQEEGFCSETGFSAENVGLAPSFAVMDCAGFDIGIIGDKVGAFGRRK